LRWQRIGVYWERKRRRTKVARPNKPLPISANVLGSGTTLVVGVVVAKQVGPGLHKSLATWTFPTVMPVVVSALVRTKISELVVRLPLASRHTVCLPTPPHAPNEREPKLTLLTSVASPFSFTSPEKPTTGPPSLTVVPPVVSISTQTEVLEKLMQLPVPPWTMVSVPTCVEPKNRFSEIVSANAAGAINRVAVIVNANSVSLFFTTLLLYGVKTPSGT
jgi:hypothetical protein